MPFSVEAKARRVVQALAALGKQRTDLATVTAVTKDSGERIVGAIATIGGVSGQPVAIDIGSPVGIGDTYKVANHGSPSAPQWRVVSRVHTVASVPWADGTPEFPAPDGLTLSTSFSMQLDGTMLATVHAWWLTLAETFGMVDFEVQYAIGSGGKSSLTVHDKYPQTTLAAAVTSAITKLAVEPPDEVFPDKGRIKIGAELIDYATRTSEEGEDGIGGVGGLLSFYVATATWDVDEWTNYALIDSAGSVFLVESNTADTLTLDVGTPANGAWSIRPCFSDCTRHVGGTPVSSHDAGRSVYRRSCDVTIPALPVMTDVNVRVRAIRLTAVGAWTNWSTIETDIDTTAPPAPTGVVVADGVGGVQVSWAGPILATCPDLAGFYVYQATSDLGANAELVATLSVTYSTFVYVYRGMALYYNLKAFDTSGNVSDYGDTWVLGTSSPGQGVQLLSNADLERDLDADGDPDDWNANIGTGVASYGDYGVYGHGYRLVQDDSEYNHIFWPGVLDMSLWILHTESQWYTTSVHLKTATDEDDWYLDNDAVPAGKLTIRCVLALTDGLHTIFYVDDAPPSHVITRLQDGWVRIATSYHSGAVSPVYNIIGWYLTVWNKTGVQATIYVDRPQLEVGNVPSEWKPGLTPQGGSSSPAGLLIDGAGIITADGTFALGKDGRMYSHLLPDADSTRDLGETSKRWETVYADHLVGPPHSDLGSIGANDHHNQAHAVTGADHTVTGSQYDLVGLTGTDTLGILTPSNTPGNNTIVKTGAAGAVQFVALGVAAATLLTISGGSITRSRSFHKIATEGGADDDLDTINGGSEGALLVIRANAGGAGNKVTVKDGTGNLKLAGDFDLDTTTDMLVLMHDGSNWIELCRSNNG